MACVGVRTVVATGATTAEATPCCHTGCRSVAGVGALGLVRVGICVVVDSYRASNGQSASEET